MSQSHVKHLKEQPATQMVLNMKAIHMNNHIQSLRRIAQRPTQQSCKSSSNEQTHAPQLVHVSKEYVQAITCQAGQRYKLPTCAVCSPPY